MDKMGSFKVPHNFSTKVWVKLLLMRSCQLLFFSTLKKQKILPITQKVMPIILTLFSKKKKMFPIILNYSGKKGYS